MSYIPLERCYKVTLEELRDIARDFHGIIHHVYAHWTAGHYSQAYDDYHICIDHDGKHDINDTMLFAYISLKHNGNITNIEGFLTPRGVQKALFFYA